MPGNKVVTAIDPDILSTEVKAKSLNAMTLTKEKNRQKNIENNMF